MKYDNGFKNYKKLNRKIYVEKKDKIRWYQTSYQRKEIKPNLE